MICLLGVTHAEVICRNICTVYQVEWLCSVFCNDFVQFTSLKRENLELRGSVAYYKSRIGTSTVCVCEKPERVVVYRYLERSCVRINATKGDHAYELSRSANASVTFPPSQTNRMVMDKLNTYKQSPESIRFDMEMMCEKIIRDKMAVVVHTTTRPHLDKHLCVFFYCLIVLDIFLV